MAPRNLWSCVNGPGDGSFLVSPALPISSQPIAERGRFFGVESRPECQRCGAQFALTPLDQPIKSLQFTRVAIAGTLLFDGLSEDDEVMVVTQVFTECLQFTRHGIH